MRTKILALFAALMLALGVGLATAGPASADNVVTPMNGAWTKVPGITYVSIRDTSSTHWHVTSQINTWNSYLAVNNIPLRYQSVGTCANGTPRCINVNSTSSCQWTAAGGVVGGYTDFTVTFGVLTVRSITFYECAGLVNSTPQNVLDEITGHEMGHGIGLAHHPVHHNGDIDMMQATLLPGETPKWWPSTWNMQGLKTRY